MFAEIVFLLSGLCALHVLHALHQSLLCFLLSLSIVCAAVGMFESAESVLLFRPAVRDLRSNSSSSLLAMCA